MPATVPESECAGVCGRNCRWSDDAVASEGAEPDAGAPEAVAVDLAGVDEQDARRMAVVRVVLVSALLALSLTGCENKPDLPGKGPPPLPPRPPEIAAGSASAAATASAPPVASIALPAAADGAFAGTWEGSYDAKKGSVVLPDKVKDKTRGDDE